MIYGSIQTKEGRPHSPRITSEGDNLDYDGDTTPNFSAMETINIHWNSVISMLSFKYCTGNILNIYMESDVTSPQFIHFQYDQIPPNISTE